MISAYRKLQDSDYLWQRHQTEDASLMLSWQKNWTFIYWFYLGKTKNYQKLLLTQKLSGF